MTTRDLEVFAAVAEHGSMSAAARALRVSQSSVSQAVADIEREYGVLLFDRCAHSLHLTPTGETLLAYAQKTLFLVREIDGFLRSGTCRSELRVGASVTVGSCVLSPILRRLQAQLPGLQPRVVVSNTHEIVDLLLKSRLDVGLVEGRVDHPDLAVRPAMEDRLLIVCPPGHPFFGRPSVRPEELSGQAMVLREEGSGTRAHLEEALRGCGVACRPAWVCSSTEAILDAVRHGFGISVLSRRLVRADLDAGRLWACQAEGLDLRRSFSLVQHRNKCPFDALTRFRQVCLAWGREEDAAAL